MMLVRRCEMLPVECIVRGYLAGTGWQEYQEAGTVCGLPLPAGLREADRLPAPIFTPSTKAAGRHPRREHLLRRRRGADRRRRWREAARDLALAVYERAAAHAEARGIILADTKLELGLLDGRLVLADEVLTPDSSRFWPADGWQPGRDATELRQAAGARRARPPAAGTSGRRRPPLSPGTVAATRARYVEALRTPLGALVRRTGRAVPGAMTAAAAAARATMAAVQLSVLVEVRLRPGIADPQGATIERSLPTLGFGTVRDVTVGKAIRFTVEAEDAAPPAARSRSCASAS